MRAIFGLLAATLACALAAPVRAQPPSKKVLRYAFEVAETTLDPAKVNDFYSKALIGNVFEGLLGYDHLARPARLEPRTAEAMPQHSADYREWTVRVRPGIYFADDPAFNGKKRELVAQDYVYALKRFADPANKSPSWPSLEAEGIAGLKEARGKALTRKTPFDYDSEIEGLRALDRYTLQIKLNAPRPRFDENLAGGDSFGAVAREVVEFYGDQIDAHPVGTGAFMLAQWRRSAFIAFERNPAFRDVRYHAEPAPGDAEGQALRARFSGRRLPMVDRVEISIIEEEQPRWLAFVGGEADFAYRVGYQFAPQAMPNGKVAPNLAKRGIQGHLVVEPASNYYFFNMEDATIGGYTPERVALRRAIALGMNTPAVISYAYNTLGSLAQGPTLPHTSAYTAELKTEFSDYDPARANALLDLYGYRDRDGDGWREMPDGAPLQLKVATTPVQRDRKVAEVLTKDMKLLGIRVQLNVAQWPENLKAARAGKLQVWSVGTIATAPDAVSGFARYDSRQIGGQNMARVALPQFDALYDRLQSLPDGPERLATFRQAEQLALAYMPYKYTLNRVSLDMTQPQLIGYRRPLFWKDWWQYVDIDNSLLRQD